MTTITEIEDAVEGLPAEQRKELIERLTRRVDRPSPSGRELPIVPATGHPITQKDIDDALDAD